MANEFSLGKKNKYGEIDFSKMQSGLKNTDIDPSNKFLNSLFDKFDTSRDGKLSRKELDAMIEEFKKLAGNDNELSVSDMKKLEINGEKIGRKKAREVLNFLRSELTKKYTNNESVTVDNEGVETVKKADGTTEIYYTDGSKQINQKNGSLVLYDQNGKKINEEIVDEKNNTFTSIKYENGVETYKEIDSEYTKKIYKNDKLTKSINHLRNDAVTEYNEYGSITTYQNGDLKTTETYDLEGNITKNVIEQGNKKMIATFSNELTTQEYFVDGKKTKQFKNFGNNVQYEIEYDGNGNTKVTVQNGESIALLAKRFNCSVDDIVKLNDNGKVKFDSNGKPYFLVGEEVLVRGEFEADDTRITSRKNTEQAIGAYTEFIKQQELERAAAEERRIAEERAAEERSADLTPESTKIGSSISDESVEIRETSDGKIIYIKDGKELSEAECQKIINNDVNKIYNILKEGAEYYGTDEEKIVNGCNLIYSKEVLDAVNKKLEADGIKKYNSQSAIETFLLSEMSVNETIGIIKNMNAKGILSKEDIARNFVRELKREVEGGLGYTKTANVKNILELVTDSETRESAENALKKAKPNLEPNEGSYVRAYLLKDGWSQEEVDRFDAVWIKNNAYTEENQEHRNTVLKRLAFDHRTDESLNIALDAINNKDTYYFLENCKKEDSASKKDFHDQHEVDTYLVSRVNPEGIKTEEDVEKLSALNRLFYKNGTPGGVKAHEAAYYANVGNYAKLFESDDKQIKNCLSHIIKKGEIKDVDSFQKAYELAEAKATNNDERLDLKANAMNSGLIEFSDEEKVKTCIALMHSIDTNEGLGASQGFSAKKTNIAETRNIQLQNILLKNPQIKDKLQAEVEKGTFNYSSSTIISSFGGYTQVITKDTKEKHKELVTNSYQISNESVFLDKEGNKIEDINGMKQRNLASIEAFKDLVEQFEREHQKGVDAEGNLSDFSNWLSEYSGLGTDRGDMKNIYQEAKLALTKLEAAAEGKLRNNNGEVVSLQDFAKDFMKNIEKLQTKNGDYNQTIAIGKMIATIGPIIAVTTVATGGLSVIGAGSTLTAVGVGTATGLTTFGLNTYEQKTSITGDTAEARENTMEDSVINAFLTAIPVKVGFTTSAMSSQARSIATKAYAIGIDVSTDAFISATADYIKTGTVSEEAFIRNLIISGTASFMTHAFNGSKVNVDDAADAPVAKNMDEPVVLDDISNPTPKSVDEPVTPRNIDAPEKPAATIDFTNDDPNFKVEYDYNNDHHSPTIEWDDNGGGRMNFYDPEQSPTIEWDIEQPNILKKATVDGTAPSGGKFGADKFDATKAQTREIAQSGNIDDIADTYSQTLKHGGKQGKELANILTDENYIVEIGKQRFDITTADASQLKKIKQAVQKFANGTRNKEALLDAIDNRYAQLRQVVAPQVEVPSSSTADTKAFDDMFKKSHFKRSSAEVPNGTTDRLGRAKFNTEANELKELCGLAQTDDQLDMLLQRAKTFRSDPQRKAFIDIIENRRTELKALAQVEINTQPVAIETPRTHSTDVMDALNRRDAQLAGNILDDAHGFITPKEIDILEHNLVNNLNTPEEIENFITNLRNRVGIDPKGNMNVFEYQGKDIAGELMHKAQVKLSRVVAEQADFQNAATLLEGAIKAQRGLNGDEMLAIKSFANKSNSVDDLEKIAKALRQTKKSDARNSLLKLIDERISVNTSVKTPVADVSTPASTKSTKMPKGNNTIRPQNPITDEEVDRIYSMILRGPESQNEVDKISIMILRDLKTSEQVEELITRLKNINLNKTTNISEQIKYYLGNANERLGIIRYESITSSLNDAIKNNRALNKNEILVLESYLKEATPGYNLTYVKELLEKLPN